ncbi:ribonuclease H-like domain, reverse transcriptase, RNA-dependent DNA polymerase [Tanacetum coccineum]
METALRFTCDAVTMTPVTALYLIRRSLEVLRKFHWMILGGRFNQLSHRCCYDEEEGSYELKDLDAYLIRTTVLDNALPTKEKDPGSFTLPCIISNLCFNKALADLGASVSVIPFSTYTKLGLGELAPTKLIVELADRTVKCPKGIAENVLVRIDKFVFPVDFIIIDIPKDIKTPLILGRPFLSTAHAKIDLFKRKITLRVGNDKVVFKSDNPTRNIIASVYASSLSERMELNLEARLMGEALILNRSLDQLYGNYIELNDLNEPLELRRNQVDDLKPTIEEGEVVDEPMMDIVKTRCDNEIITGINEYPNFAVVENMDAYRDDGMGDIIVGRPFCRKACVKARRFDGMITI